MNEIIRAAEELQGFCQAQGWRFAFIGGLALQRWGEPRETVDADLTLITGFGQEESFIVPLLSHFEARIQNAAEFALKNRVLLLKSKQGVGLDVALGRLWFEDDLVDRGSFFDYPGRVALFTCSAEDLIVLKAFAGRGQDWVDIDRVLTRQRSKLDWTYIEKQLSALAELKSAPQIVADLFQRRRASEAME